MKFDMRYMNEKRLLSKQISELQVKLINTEVEGMNKQVKFLTHLADRPSTVTVESRTDRKYNTESFHSVLHSLKDVAKSFGVHAEETTLRTAQVCTGHGRRHSC